MPLAGDSAGQVWITSNTYKENLPELKKKYEEQDANLTENENKLYEEVFSNPEFKTPIRTKDWVMEKP